MNSKTYQAESMAEALAHVKRDLGRDAVILQTRNFRKGGLLGLFGGHAMWEVTATPNMNVPRRMSNDSQVSAQAAAALAASHVGSSSQSSPRFEQAVATLERPADLPEPTPASSEAPSPMPAPAPMSAPAPAMKTIPAAMPAEQSKAASPVPTAFVPPSPQAGISQESLEQQVTEIRDMVESLLTRQGRTAGPDVPAGLGDLYSQMVARDIEPELAGELLRQLRGRIGQEDLRDPYKMRRAMIDLIAEQIPVVEQDLSRTEARPRVITMIGPTGVGKTTTIAKMAANFKLQQGKRVGLITVDTYRIAAVDQLRTYAEIIEVPLRAVLTAGELHQAIHSMNDMDVVLIDTAGRSQNDQVRLSQLRGFLTAAKADEVHLVVSATAKPACLRTTLERFCPLGASRIILSKVDESETFGMILHIARAKLPMSYVTTGQDVPDDIDAAEARKLAQWIVGEQQDVN